MTYLFTHFHLSYLLLQTVLVLCYNLFDMRIGLKIAAWVYGVQAFFVVPWFLGAIYRHEMSLWAGEQYASELHRHGQGDALLGLYLYVIFYAIFVVVPYATLSLRFPLRTPELKRSFRIGRIILSVWFAGTLLLFLNPLFEFIRQQEDVLNGWLLILWGGATVFCFCIWRDLEKTRIKNKE